MNNSLNGMILTEEGKNNNFNDFLTGKEGEKTVF